MSPTSSIHHNNGFVSDESFNPASEYIPNDYGYGDDEPIEYRSLNDDPYVLKNDPVDMADKGLSGEVRARLYEGVKLPPRFQEWTNYIHPSDDDMVQAAYGEDLGMAQLIVKMFGDRIIYDEARKCWAMWQGHNWQIDNSSAVRRHCLTLIPTIYDERCIAIWKEIKALADKKKRSEAESEKLSILKDHLALFRSTSRDMRKASKFNPVYKTLITLRTTSGSDWDIQPFKLAFANGVVDMRTGILTDGDPDDMILTRSDIEWRGLDEPCPEWTKTINSIMCDDADTAEYLLNLFAYAATGCPQHHLLPVLTGSGSNGKSMVLNVLKAVMGDFFTSSSSDLVISKKRGTADSASPTVAGLQGKRVAAVLETRLGASFNEEQIKSLTGGDPISGRRLHQNIVTFKPTHTIFIATNAPPHTTTDSAMHRRLKVIEFCAAYFIKDSVDYHKRYNPDNPHHHIAEVGLERRLIETEAAGIVADLVRRVIAMGPGPLRLVEPESVRKATDAHIKDEDLVQAFIDEFYEHDTSESLDYRAACNLMYKAYSDWIKESNLGKPMSSRSFSLDMKRKGYERKRSGYWYYTGIKPLPLII